MARVMMVSINNMRVLMVIVKMMEELVLTQHFTTRSHTHHATK